MKLVSLKKKLFFSMLLVCSLIVMIVTSVEVYQLRERQKERIYSEFDGFKDGSMQLLRKAVWSYDWTMVKTIIKSQTSREISFIEVCDQQTTRCIKTGVQNQAPFLDYHSPIIYRNPTTDKAIKIGSVHLQGHYTSGVTDELGDISRLLLTNLFSVFGVAIIIFLLFLRQTVRRLVEIENYTRGIDLRNVAELKPLQFKKQLRAQDEIDLLADAVSGLVEKIREEFKRRQALELQLTQAQKMEALGTLAGGIAHDFNNILAAILGYAQLSQVASEPDSKLHRRLEQIIRAGQRAKALIAQIMIFSRRSGAHREIVVLAKLVEETLTLMRASLPAHIRIETTVDESLQTLGDPNQLHQVIMNLATNAGQVMAKTGGQLTTNLSRVELTLKQARSLNLDAGPYARLRVSDTGPGIAPEIQQRIFEPFFTTKKVGQGTGMGLAVVHGIVLSHGGAIALEDEPGAGATFSVYLPENNGEPGETEQPDLLMPGHGEHLLIVDDEKDVAEVGSDALQGCGYQVTVFTDPCKVLDYFDAGGSADLLLTDLTMPKLSGVELATRVRKQHPDMPVLIWTGFVDDLEQSIFEHGEIIQVLHKPFTIESLARAVQQLLVRQQGINDREGDRL